MAGQYRDMDLAWNEFFTNPSQWWDNRNNKRNPRFPDFKHKTTKEALWINGRYNPTWVDGELIRSGLCLPQEAKDRDASVPKNKKLVHRRQDEEGDEASIGSTRKDQGNVVALLKACAEEKDLRKGSRIHADVCKRGLLGTNTYVGNILVTMYAKCGALRKAQEVFDELPVRNVVSWNALIAGYAQQGLGHEALNCFERMQHQGPSPNVVTFICILKACGSIGAVQKGEEIHAEVVKQGLLKKDTILGNALVDMYAKCGALAKAREVFDELPVRNVVSFNGLITGYAQHGHGHEALNCFERMQHEGLSPNAVTFICILRACGSVGAAVKGEEVHAEVKRQGLLETNGLLGTALMDMYAKCGDLVKAQELLDELPTRDVVTWSALIAGYAQHGQGHEALNCFERMKQQGLSPNAVTYTSILKACGVIGAVEKGVEIHAEVARKGLLETDTILGNALVDMYAKFGALEQAQEVFNELPVRNIVSWCSLIAGYAQLGKVETVFISYNKMLEAGVVPNTVIFVVLLNACSHAGLVEKGQTYFESMSSSYGIIPTLEHHTCMVDLFGRAGHFDKALGVIEKMPPLDSPDYLALWSSLLGACQKWGNVKLGRVAFERAVQLDAKDDAAYICMSNIYVAASMREEALKIEALRVKNKAWKVPGCCWWSDASGNVHSFVVGESNHAQLENINMKLNDIGQKLSQEGYFQSLHCASQDIPDDANIGVRVICMHSEKLAIACALINTPAGTPIHVTKNVQVCSDCHYAIMLISNMEKRKIVVRDANRFHIFEDGKCACSEYC